MAGAAFYFLAVSIKLIATLAGVVAVFWIVSKLWPGLHQRSPDEKPIREMILSVFNLPVWAAASVILAYTNQTWRVPLVIDLHDAKNFSLLVPEFLRIEFPATMTVTSAISWVYYPAWFAFVVLLTDAAFYWVHRLMHVDFFYKALHRVHHRFLEPTAWCAYSFHFLESVLIVLAAGVLPHLFLPMDLLAAVVFNSIAVFWSAFLHSRLSTESWQAHPLLRYVNSPSLHRLHHQTGSANFSLYFTIWDKAFGTDRNKVKLHSALAAETD